MKFILSMLMMFLLANCTLTENKKPEEGKNYVDQVHEVELVDYEFEQRLDSFYESDPIENQELYDLYDGKFPDNNRNPRELRIHWKDARELALAELDLQKPIQENWKDATLSERPILVLDRDGGDFYRYYEYRVVRDKKYLGAILIPAYRRTENFATAEVHLYSDDEKTYTIHPTGWYISIINNMKFNENSQFMQNIQKQIRDNISDNLAFTYGVNMIKSSPELMPNKSISLFKSDAMFYKDPGALVDHDPWFSQMQNQMKGKGHVIETGKRNMTKYNKQAVSGQLANTMNLITYI